MNFIHIEFAFKISSTTVVKMFKKITLICTLLPLVFAAGCTTQHHVNSVRDESGDRLTVGKVQKTIKVGITNAEVIETLGSPNVISTDDQGREVWVYDKISTESVYSTSSAGGGIASLILGGTVGAGLGLSGEKHSGAKSTRQRTLTIIVKMDKNGLVRDIAYHSSQF